MSDSSTPAVPPSRIVELRTHGVSGTPPESILRWDNVIQVAGDDLGRFHRRATPGGHEVTAEPIGDTPRQLESYHWGAMTSGGWKKAAWITLLPFGFANLAQWTLPAAAGRGAVPGRTTRRSALVALARAIIRVAALGLTMLFAVQVEVVVVDLVASQCLANNTHCLETVAALDVLRRHLTLTAVLAVLVLVGVVGALWWLSRDSLSAGTDEAIEKETTRPDRQIPRVGARSFTASDVASGALRVVHAVAALAVVTIVFAGGWKPAPGAGSVVPWWIAFVLLILAVLAVTLLDDPSGGTGRWARLRAVIAWRQVGAVWVAVASANLVAVAAATGYTTLGTGSARLRSAEDYVLDQLMPVLAVLTGALLVVVLLLRPSTRAGRRDMPRQYRPWLGGTLAPFLVAFAALSGAGLGTATAMFTDNCVTNSCKPRAFGASADKESQLPTIYHAVTLMWGMVTAVVVVVGPVALLVAYQWKKHRYAVQTLVQRGKAERTSWFTANIKFSAQYVLLGVTVVAVMSALAALFAAAGVSVPEWVRRCVEHDGPLTPVARWLANLVQLDNPGVVHFLQSVGVFGLVAAIVWLIAAVRKAAKNPADARNLGVVWDVASFWPSEAHPFVPSGYAQRALPDLQTRVESYLTDPATKVVLCGHSQGSLIVYAVAWRMVAEHRGTAMLDRFGLITHGSQLRWIFPRVFPGMLDFTDHVNLMADVGGRWHNVVRFTDPVGGPVLSWKLTAPETTTRRIHGTVLPAPGTGTGDEVTSQSCESCEPGHGVEILGHEHWLPDPVLPDPGPITEIAPIGRGDERSGEKQEHSNHPYDAHWPHVVACAAGVAASRSTAPDPALDETTRFVVTAAVVAAALIARIRSDGRRSPST